MIRQLTPSVDRALTVAARLVPMRRGSKAEAIPLADLEAFRVAQRLTRRAILDACGHLREGWSEKRLAEAIRVRLHDLGAQLFYHVPIVWFGERTRTTRILATWPSERVLLPESPYIIDVAAVVNGYVASVSVSGTLRETPQMQMAREGLAQIRAQIPPLFAHERPGTEVWRRLENRIVLNGFECLHAQYPLGIAGHQLQRSRMAELTGSQVRLGWPGYWDFGVFQRFFGREHAAPLSGVWAIKPHLGVGESFGVKFGEALVITPGGEAEWLDETPVWENAWM